MSFKFIWPAKRSGIAISAKNVQNLRRLSIVSSLFSTVLKGMSWFENRSTTTIFKGKMHSIADIIKMGSNNGPCPKLSTDVGIASEFQNDVQTEKIANDLGEEKVIKDWIHNLKQSKYYFGEAIFVLGPMGAGKSTVVEEIFKKHEIYRNYAYVDTDAVMEKLDGFDSERVEDFYPIARSIAIRLTDWLLDENISFIAEGTCVKYLELEDYIHRLKNKGYVIKVKHVNSISLKEVLKRASKRKRKIPDDVVQSIYYGSLIGVSELKKLNVNNSLFQEL